jgi:hypothetical protein
VIFAIATVALVLLTAVLLRPEQPTVTYDRRADVLSVVRRGAETVDTMPAEHDGWLLVNRDHADDVVGVQLLAASEMPRGFWAVHPDREEIPPDLLAALDRWIGAVHLHPPAREGERVTDRL